MNSFAANSNHPSIHTSHPPLSEQPCVASDLVRAFYSLSLFLSLPTHPSISLFLSPSLSLSLSLSLSHQVWAHVRKLRLRDAALCLKSSSWVIYEVHQGLSRALCALCMEHSQSELCASEHLRPQPRRNKLWEKMCCCYCRVAGKLRATITSQQ